MWLYFVLLWTLVPYKWIYLASFQLEFLILLMKLSKSTYIINLAMSRYDTITICWIQLVSFDESSASSIISVWLSFWLKEVRPGCQQELNILTINWFLSKTLDSIPPVESLSCEVSRIIVFLLLDDVELNPALLTKVRIVCVVKRKATCYNVNSV